MPPPDFSTLLRCNIVDGTNLSHWIDGASGPWTWRHLANTITKVSQRTPKPNLDNHTFAAWKKGEQIPRDSYAEALTDIFYPLSHQTTSVAKRDNFKSVWEHAKRNAPAVRPLPASAPTSPLELPPRLPNTTTNTAAHPAGIARLSATLRASNDPEAAFYVYATPTFGSYRDEQNNIALEIGVAAATLTADSPSHEYVDHSELGTRSRPHDHITHEAAGWRITGGLDATGVLRGPATQPADGYLLAMRTRNTAPEEVPTAPHEVVLRLHATRADFIVRPTQHGAPTLPNDLKQKVLDAKVFEVLNRQRDNPRTVELASAIAKMNQP